MIAELFNGQIRQIKSVITTKNYSLLYRRSNLPGSIMMPFSKLKTPSTAIPINRKGRLSIQKKGYNTKAKIARGQQSINRIIQAMNINIE